MKLWRYDFEHIGQLFEHVRTGRDAKPATIRHYCLRKFADQIFETYITDVLEARGESKPYRFAEYVDALQSSEVANPPLTKLQADRLIRLKEYSDNTRQYEDSFFEIDLDSIYRPELQGLRAKLSQSQYPAFIMDALWHILAVNGAALRLLGIENRIDYLEQREAWHTLATKFAPGSPVRDVHDLTEAYFPPVIEEFVADADLEPYFFTRYLFEPKS